MMRRIKSPGFTLVELLVVIGIIALLAAILLPAVRAAFVKADRNKAEIETKSLKNAVQAFLNDYGKLPAPAGDQGQTDKTYDDANSKAIVKALTANDASINPKNVAYLEAQTNAVDGTFLDPWDRQYRLVLDTDYDSKTAYNSLSYGTACLAISAGPDGQFVNADDITSSK